MIGLRSSPRTRFTVFSASRSAETIVVRARMQRLLRCFGLTGALLAASGCGAAAYSVNVVRAARSVERARQVGADKHAPFEMTLAQAYLEKAREESAEASYEDAVRFAKLAQASGDAAAERSRGASQGAPQ